MATVVVSYCGELQWVLTTRAALKHSSRPNWLFRVFRLQDAWIVLNELGRTHDSMDNGLVLNVPYAVSFSELCSTGSEEEIPVRVVWSEAESERSRVTIFCSVANLLCKLRLCSFRWQVSF